MRLSPALSLTRIYPMPALDTQAPDQGAASPPPGWPAGLVQIRVWIVKEDSTRWIALAEDFDVAGQGATERAAAENMGELLADYLNLCFAEGKSFGEARRPIPWLAKLRLRVLHLLGRLHARLAEAYRRTFDIDLAGHVTLHAG